MQKLTTFDLSGRTAVVTGGSKGLGKSLARILASAGAKVLIGGRRVEELKQSAADLRADTGAEVVYAAVDLGNRAGLPSFVREAERQLAHVDIFVANAAMEHQTMVDAVDEQVMDQLLETNVVSNILLTSAFTPGMKERRWGRIIYISSNAAAVASHWGHGVYSASKAALEAYARSAAIELGRFGITANTIAPGTYATSMVKDRWNDMGPDLAKQSHDILAQMNAVGRWGEPWEMEGAALLLASDAGSFISGIVLPVDGGLTIKMVPSP